MDALLIYRDGKFVGKQILRGEEWLIGRGGDIVLDSLQVSRRHALVRRREGGFCLVDLGSANGTTVNGAPLTAVNDEHPIADGDEIGIGDFALRCAFGKDVGLDETKGEQAAPRRALPPPESLEPTVRRRRSEMAQGGGAAATAEAPPAPAVPAALRELAARLVVVTGEVRARFPLEAARVTIGRGPENDVAVGDPSVAPRQATLRFADGAFALAAEAAGTFVAGVPVAPGEAISLGDEAAIAFGDAKCLYIRAAGPEAAAADERVLARLVAAGRLTASQAEDIASERRAKGYALGEALVLRGFLSPADWVRARHAGGAERRVARRLVLGLLLVIGAVGALLAAALAGGIDLGRLLQGGR
jgi:pSer/pThr/pTyr-binding forkhead associated (FHA) protein